MKTNSPLLNQGSPFGRALQHSLPVCAGYIPVGITFGLLFTQEGLPGQFAVLSSLVINSGSAQLLSIDLFLAHASLIEMGAMLFSLNLRHLFYGLSFLKRYSTFSPAGKAFGIFGLTDEVFSVASAHREESPRQDEAYCLWLTFLNQSYRVIGTILGVVVASQAHVKIKGLEFVLTALFVVLLVEQARKIRRVFPFAIALAFGVLGIFVFPKQMLTLSLAMSAAILMIISFRKKESA